MDYDAYETLGEEAGCAGTTPAMRDQGINAKGNGVLIARMPIAPKRRDELVKTSDEEQR